MHVTLAFWVAVAVYVVFGMIIIGGYLTTIVHECGHLLACRRLKVPVREVCIGMGTGRVVRIGNIPWRFGWPALVGRSGYVDPVWPSDRNHLVELYASGPRMSGYAAGICFLGMLVPAAFWWVLPLWLGNVTKWIGNYAYFAKRSEASDGLGIRLANTDPNFAPPTVNTASDAYRKAVTSFWHKEAVVFVFALMVAVAGASLGFLFWLRATLRI